MTITIHDKRIYCYLMLQQKIVLNKYWKALKKNSTEEQAIEPVESSVVLQDKH